MSFERISGVDARVRRATAADADAIAEAHVDSIRTVGARAYGPEIIDVWARPRDGAMYAKAMAEGETFFVATPRRTDGSDRVLGFSSHRVVAGAHRTAVYVRGEAARSGVGTALFDAGQAEARRQGAEEIHVDASLAAVEFYRACGFEVVGSGEHRLRGGVVMPCVFMRKALTAHP